MNESRLENVSSSATMKGPGTEKEIPRSWSENIRADFFEEVFMRIDEIDEFEVVEVSGEETVASFQSIYC